MIESFQHKDFTVEIHADDSSESPREWDNLSTMTFFHGRHQLGDTDHGYDSKDFFGWSQLKAQIIRDLKPTSIVPVFMFDHSGITIGAEPERFRNWDQQGWDWGQIGFAFISREKALGEYGGIRLTPAIREESMKTLLGEIETYDRFLRGDVCGYAITDAEGEIVDSCWGLYGFDYAKREATLMAARCAEGA